MFLVVDEGRLDEAVRGLVRVGLDRVVGYLTPQMLDAFAAGGGRLARTETIDMAELEKRRAAGHAHVLDVRGTAEFEAGHIAGAIHIPHTRVQALLASLPTDAPLLVHCNSGARAAAAVSVLERAGFRATHVNDMFANYCQVELPGQG